MIKCTICGKEINDIGELDVPFHVECVLESFKKLNGTVVTESNPPGNGHKVRRSGAKPDLAKVSADIDISHANSHEGDGAREERALAGQRQTAESR